VQSALTRTDFLWVTLAGERNTTGVPKLDVLVTSFGDAVLKPDGRKLSDIDRKVSPHRFRYSVTRLVALSLEGATQIMFDVLGHDDKEVNLDSMLNKIVGAELFERAFLHNQILANLQPFPDLIDEFASDPRLQAALVDCDPHRWAALESELRERLDPLLGMGS
jgi:hypothetical protein